MKRKKAQKMKVRAQRHAERSNTRRLRTKVRRITYEQRSASRTGAQRQFVQGVDTEGIGARMMGGLGALLAARRKMVGRAEEQFAPGRYTTNKAGKLQRVGKAEESGP